MKPQREKPKVELLPSIYYNANSHLSWLPVLTALFFYANPYISLALNRMNSW